MNKLQKYLKIVELEKRKALLESQLVEVENELWELSPNRYNSWGQVNLQKEPKFTSSSPSQFTKQLPSFLQEVYEDILYKENK